MFNLCKRGKALAQRWLRTLDVSIKRYLPAVRHVVQVIKTAVDSKFTLTFVELTRFTWDDRLRDIISEALAFALTELSLIDGCSKLSGVEQINCYVNSLRGQPAALREAIYNKIASLMLEYSHGRTEKVLKRNEYDLIVQTDYSLLKG